MNLVRNILAILLLVVTSQSSFFFLKVLKVKFIEWIVFNACAVSNITFLTGWILVLLLKNRTVLHTAILPMFFFGVGGLFVFSWKGMNIIPQIGHIIMTLNIIWTLFETFKIKDYKSASIGLLLGVIIFSFFIAFQQNYVNTHQEDFQKIMQIEKPR